MGRWGWGSVELSNIPFKVGLSIEAWRLGLNKRQWFLSFQLCRAVSSSLPSSLIHFALDFDRLVFLHLSIGSSFPSPTTGARA